MAKVLIIDDHLTMVDLIFNQLQSINRNLSTDDVFCFDYDNIGELEIQVWAKQRNLNRRILFGNDNNAIFEKVYEFLQTYSGEQILILIDLLLKSQNINAPSKERYQENQEFSCDLYTELMKIKNGKTTKYCIDRTNFFFLLYSRSDASNSVVASMLHQLYTEKEAIYFPCECYLSENISWCKNRCEETDENNLVVRNQECANQPLALPDEFEAFIARLT